MTDCYYDCTLETTKTIVCAVSLSVGLSETFLPLPTVSLMQDKVKYPKFVFIYHVPKIPTGSPSLDHIAVNLSRQLG